MVRVILTVEFRSLDYSNSVHPLNFNFREHFSNWPSYHIYKFLYVKIKKNDKKLFGMPRYKFGKQSATNSHDCFHLGELGPTLAFGRALNFKK